MKRKLLSLVLVLAMAISLFPISALAAENGTSESVRERNSVAEEEYHEPAEEAEVRPEPTETASVTSEDPFTHSAFATEVPELMDGTPMSLAVTPTSGACGDNLTWNFDESTGILTISGTGTMTDVNTYTAPWAAFKSQIETVVLEHGVSSIGEHAFDGCDALKSVTIPDSVTSIGSYAFWECSNLPSVTIPNSTIAIGDFAFYGCSNLTSVIIPSSVTSMGARVFSECNKLISAGPIGGNYNLQLGWTEQIPEYAFHLTELTTVIIPDGIVTISDGAFSYCNNLTSVVIPDSVTNIGNRVFDGCPNLTSAGPIGENYNIQLGWSEHIPDSAFRYAGCNNLVSVTIPDGITSIGEYAFYGYTSLETIIISDNVTTIGDFAFYGCTSLENVIIPGSVTNIGDYVFSECSTLKSAGPIGGDYNIQFGWTERIPDNVFHNLDTLTNVIIPDGIISVGNSAFHSCKSLTDVTLPDGITNIGDRAFYACESLTDFAIPDSVTNIGSYAFSGCTGITNIAIPNGVTHIESGAFSGTGLVHMTIPDSVTVIGVSTFENCTSLADVRLPDNLQYIYNYAFYGCSSLQEITIPESVIEVGISAFYNCDNLRTVTINHGYIMATAFGYCDNLSEINFGKYYDTTGDGRDYLFHESFPFKGCQNISTITGYCGESAYWTLSGSLDEGFLLEIDGTGSTWNYDSHNSATTRRPLFSLWSSYINTAVIGSGIQTVGDGLLRWLSKLQKLTVMDGVEYLGADLCSGCYALESVLIPKSVTEIGVNAFEDCTLVNTLEIGSIVPIANNAFVDCTNIPSAAGFNGDTSWNMDIGPNNISLRIFGIGKMKDMPSLGAPRWLFDYSTFSDIPVKVDIEEGVLSVGAYSFADCKNVQSVSLPHTIETIGNSAFQNCSISSINIPGGVTDIGSSAFNDCMNLTDVMIQDGVTSIGDYAFSGCTSLTSIIIPDSITSIGDYIFLDCSALTTAGPIGGDYNIQLGWTNQIPAFAFKNCDSLISVIIPNNVTSIGEQAFYNCAGLTSVIIPNSVTSIGENAFYNCTGLTNVVIPDSVTSIGGDAFQYCAGLTSVIIPASVTDIGEWAFHGCDNLTDVYYSGSKEDWATIDIGRYNDELTDATIHYNSTGPDGGDGDQDIVIDSVEFLSDWDADTRRVTLGSRTAPSSYTISDSVDVSSMEEMVGQYVQVIMDSDNVMEIAAIHPVDSYLGTVSEEGVDSLTIDGTTYPVADGASLGIYEGKEVLYHIYDGTIVSLSLLEDVSGTLEAWDSEKGQITVDGTVYFLTDLSDLSSVDTDALKAGSKATFRTVYQGKLFYNTPILGALHITEPDDGIMDIDEFNPTIYRANYLYRGTDTPSSNVRNTINEVTPAEASIEALQEAGVEDALTLWKSFDLISGAVDDPTVLYDFAAEPKDLYSAVILNALEASATYDWIPAEMEDTLKLCDTFVSTVKDLMEFEYGIDIQNDNDFENLNDAQREKLAELTEAWFTEEQPDLCALSDVFSAFTKATKVVGNIEDYFERIASCAMVANMNEYMKEVLHQVYQDSLSTGNLALQLALADCVEVMDSSTAEVIAKIITDEVVVVGTDAAKYLIKEVLWDQVAKTLYATHPAAAVFQAAYKSGKFISNLLYNTDNTYEQYLKMLAVTDVENLVDYTYRNLEDTFANRKDLFSASVYLSAIDLIFSLRDEDSVRVYELVDVLDQSLVNQIVKLFGKDTYAATREYLRTRQQFYGTTHAEALTAWIYLLEEDYPGSGLYEQYQGLIDTINDEYCSKEFLAACPVDVYVYDDSDRLVASVVDGCVSNDGDVLIALIGDTKVVRFYNGDENYRIEYVGTDQGKMDITISEFNSNEEVVRTVNYNDVELQDGIAYTAEADDTSYELTNKADGSSVPCDYDSLDVENDRTHTVSVQSGSLVRNDEVFLTTEANAGETLEINAYIPEGYHFMYWEASNGEDIFADKASGSTTFIMPDEDVVVRAIIQIDAALSVPVEKVMLNQSTLTIPSGTTKALTATITPDDAADKTLIWTSSDPAVATVDETGLVTAISNGTATITASAIDGGHTATCQVTVISSTDTGGSTSGGSSTSSSNSSSSYDIDAPSDIENGKVIIDSDRADEGDTVTITVTPDDGYVLDDLTVLDSDGNKIKVEKVSKTEYTFEMPRSAVTVEATFALATEETEPLPFTDVTEGTWYYDAVRYAYGNDLMAGTSATTFSPNLTTTRGMIVTILYRLEGSPTASTAPAFTDVPDGQWYSDAVAWAATNNIVGGYGNGLFGPDDPITREQLAAILYRYAQYKSYDTTASDDLSRYTDLGQLSEWAQEAVAWANSEGIISGTSADTLAPKDSATRAQAAAMMMRFCVNITP